LAALKRAYKTLYKSGLGLEEARTTIAAEAETVPELRPLADFLAMPGRGIIR
jgi:UDP-N-acetylglucosamine acyltransferase